MSEWNLDIDAAPKDKPILVAYDHDRDTYVRPENHNLLTPYACHAESGDFMDKRGVCIAKWSDGWFESEDCYGNGYDMPGFWFAWFNNDYADQVVFPVAWREIPAYDWPEQ